jgi:DNA-3-methyladenine glycosylase II
MTTHQTSPRAYLSNNDAHLKHIIAMLSEPQYETTNDVFYDISSCIVGQQIHYRNEKVAFQRFKTLFTDQYPRPEAIATIHAEVFLTLKISAQKYDTLHRLSEWWLQNNINDLAWDTKSDEEVRAMLLGIKGIGAWTVDMILLWTLERDDVFPIDDYSLKKIMTQVYGLDFNKNLKVQMTNIASAWMPHRSLACRYLWASV